MRGQRQMFDVMVRDKQQQGSMNAGFWLTLLSALNQCGIRIFKCRRSNRRGGCAMTLTKHSVLI